jgi:anti-sigma B factor antagonist
LLLSDAESAGILAIEVDDRTLARDGRRVVRVALGGELDLAGVPALERVLADAEATGPVAIVVDLTALEFLDSSGLRCLVRAHGRAREAGGRLPVVRADGGEVAQAMSVTGLDAHLEVFADLDSALS